MRKYFQIILFLITSFGFMQSQNFTASVNKKTITTGEYLQLVFSINSNASNFVPPDFKDFDVYSGPNQSTSMSFINGTMSSSISLSYYLVAKREGKFTIGPAKINAGGKQLQSNPVTVEVVKDNGSGVASGSNNNSRNNSGGSSSNQRNDQTASVSGDEIFLKTIVSKQKCFMGEQITITQKIYSSYQMRGFQNFKAPAYNGFWSKEESRSTQLTQKTENYDGRNFYVVEFNSTILFPQETGKLSIDPVEIDVVAAVQSNRKPRSLFEQFFGGGGYEDKVFKIKSRKVEINVSPLPSENKPENFSGAVGNFTFKAEIDNEKVRANDPINLKLTVSGKGNINLVSAPNISFPAEFETYDPKINENISVSGIVSGSKTYDYLIIPRKEGNYKISQFNFSYFDPEKKQYILIPSPEFNISVSPGAAGSSSSASVYTPKNEIQKTENDIRYIKKGNLELKEMDTEFFSSAKHYGTIAGVMMLFLSAIAFQKHQIKLNSNLSAVKERKAAKMARKKLANAEKLLDGNDKSAFYNEISVALNQYIGNKLGIPQAELSRVNIKNQMDKRKIPSETIDSLIKTLDDCEYVKYAPGAVTDNFKATFEDTVKLITDIEEQSKA